MVDRATRERPSAQNEDRFYRNLRSILDRPVRSICWPKNAIHQEYSVPFGWLIQAPMLHGRSGKAEFGGLSDARSQAEAGSGA